MATLAINILLVLALASLSLVYSMRGHAAVGGWLVVVPPFFLTGWALVSMIGRGRFAWAGGRPFVFLLLVGFSVAFLSALCFALDDSDMWWAQVGLVAPPLMLLACLLAANDTWFSPNGLRAAITAVLGVSVASGYVLIVIGTVMYVRSVQDKQQAVNSREMEWQRTRAAEYYAIAADAPLWHYFRFMFEADDALRNECRSLIAKRPDLDEKLIEYLANESLEMDAVRYLGRIYPSPPAAKFAAAYGQFLERKLVYIRANGGESWVTGERMKSDMRAWFETAQVLRKAGCDLSSQMKQWRDYLLTVKGMEDMAGGV